jgi:PAS domain-containing protein
MTKAAPDPTRQGLSPSVAEGARGRRHLPETVVRERTIADIAAGLAPGWRCQDIFAWPPDGFAFSSTVLSESGAYRLIVSPPRGKRWPPPDEVGGERWEEAVHDWAGEWASWAVVRGRGVRRPSALSRLASMVHAARHVQLANLDEPRNWTTLVALLTLHAMADEACAGLGLDRRAGDAFHEQAEDLLRENGTLSRFAGTRARVLPKSSLPRTGISIRSLSRHLSLDRSETEVRWYHSDAARSSPSLFKVLLVPYPARVAAADFRAIPGPLDNMDPDQFGFFEFAPRRPLDINAVLRVAEVARTREGAVDAVVLPESVLELHDADRLRRGLHESGVPHLIAGVREPATTPSGFGRNYAYVTGTRDGASWAEVQHKHHRWSLEEAQIRQYHLGSRLPPGRRWWEAIRIERRSLMFVTIDPMLTLCPLICEDLAQPDPVATIIRQVGPSLVIGLLLDGPQLAVRWPARYASVFADDPGCAVLTLTSIGMATRSRPPGFAPSRSVALWKDACSGIQELTLDDGAVGLLLTTRVHHRFAMTADGRSVPTAQLLLEDVRQVAGPSRTGARRGRAHLLAPGQPTGRDSPTIDVQARSAVAAPDVRSDDAVYVCDTDTNIVSWNRAAEKLTGISARQAVGRRCSDVIRGLDDSGDPVCKANCVVAQRARRGRPVACPPIVIQTRRGARPLSISTLIVREGAAPLVVHLARGRTT